MDSIGLAGVRRAIEVAAQRVGRHAEHVTLVVVSKGRSIEEIARVYETGHRDFGENRAEELADKARKLPRDIHWHMVGTIQRRKAALVGEHAQFIHSLDRASLAERLAGLENQPPLLVQVNLASEQQKHGVDFEGVELLIERSLGLGLTVKGLMILPPLPLVPEDSRQWFARLRVLRDRLVRSYPTVKELSMGMTDDFEIAVEEGATLLRVGRAIFEDAAV